MSPATGHDPGPRAGGEIYQSVLVTAGLPILWSDGRNTNIITDIESVRGLRDVLLVLFKI